MAGIYMAEYVICMQKDRELDKAFWHAPAFGLILMACQVSQICAYWCSQAVQAACSTEFWHGAQHTTCKLRQVIAIMLLQIAWQPFCKAHGSGCMTQLA